MALPDERFEMCWMLDAATTGRILPALRVRLLPCPLGGAQRVQSLYFGPAPGPGLGGEPRRRLRIRLHETDARPERCVVEVKHRVGLRSVVHHAAVTLADARALVAGAPIPAPPAARHVFEEARDLISTQDLRPSALVAHERVALVGDAAEPDLRVTFDSGLAWSVDDLSLAPRRRRFEGELLPKGHSLLVVKVALAVPSWLTLLLGRHGASQRSVGKHALALEAAARNGAASPDAVLKA